MPGETSEQTRNRLYTYAQDNRIFQEKEVEQNLAKLKWMESLVEQGPIHCFVDGSLRIPPGEDFNSLLVRAGGGFLIEANKERLVEKSFSLPTAYGEKRTSNHIAEYEALLACLDYLKQEHHDYAYLDIIVWTDSEDLVKQVGGASRIRDPIRRSFRNQALEHMKGFRKIEVRHCKRKYNQEADRLAKAGLESEHLVTAWKG